MKTKKLEKKLNVRKKTVADLNFEGLEKEDLVKIVGGSASWGFLGTFHCRECPAV